MRKHLLIVLLLVSLAGIASDLKQAIDRRKAGDLSRAERLLRDYSSPANFEQLSYPDKIAFMRGLLELAHVRALKDDVPGALALLNWAEGRSDDYLRAVACVKYAEILIDLGEFERAEGYLKNADEVFVKRVTSQDTADGIAIGQGGETVDSGAAWRGLRDESDVLKADIEAETMKRRFGATYGNYVKLRRLQRLAKRSRVPRYLKEALAVADEIIDIDPASQFAAAAGYLKGEILASRLTETTTKDAKDTKKYLEKFVKAQPDGLYRGEALMLLGKISLEIEWDAKDAEKYYAQALDYFRKAREKRDAVSLYAAINDDLKKQSAPTQKPTTLNQWKRTVYHDEDPLKLYNTANAPAWYVDDKEKNCLFMLGFLKLVSGRIKEAGKLFEQVKDTDENLAGLDAKNIPNAILRLRYACEDGRMVFSEEEKKTLDNKKKIKVAYAELLYLLERFDESKSIFETIANDSKSSDDEKALAYIGLGNCAEMRNYPRTKAERLELLKKYYGRALELAGKGSIRGHALMMNGYYLAASSMTWRMSREYFERYLRLFPDGRFAESAWYRLAHIHALEGELYLTKKILQKLKEKDSESGFVKHLELIIKNQENKKETKR